MLALLLLVGSNAHPPQTADSARNFVESLYARYESATNRAPNLLGRDGQTVFSPPLFRLIRRDAETTPQGYVGRLDFDPICACQDPDGMRLETIALTRTKDGPLLATVTLGYADSTQRIVRLTLIATQSGWRVDDVGSAGAPSLRKLLRSH